MQAPLVKQCHKCLSVVVHETSPSTRCSGTENALDKSTTLVAFSGTSDAAEGSSVGLQLSGCGTLDRMQFITVMLLEARPHAVHYRHPA